jgi:hypothetical protein
MKDGAGEAERSPSTERRIEQDDSAIDCGRGAIRANDERREEDGEAEVGRLQADISST